MHEYSLCEGILAGVRSELEKIHEPSFRLITVKIVVGALRRVVPETLRLAYEILTSDTDLSSSQLEIHEEPVTCACLDCAWKGSVTLPIFRCGECGSGRIEVKTGMELYIDSLEVDIVDKQSV